MRGPCRAQAQAAARLVLVAGVFGQMLGLDLCGLRLVERLGRLGQLLPSLAESATDGGVMLSRMQLAVLKKKKKEKKESKKERKEGTKKMNDNKKRVQRE
mgnify:CR=1 FL=1